ncbi:M20 metallopeptidase family protein [Thalassobacillus pellis]|uniref:M20 metallopeptidase family protein n=1 Tax=Thalassobacillus pellis TaxID=748008 RepID=UPI00195F3023|nr:M20 family metallopeptidase [Thalassobacillus pellis]MBM7552005.1 amidohydrolase [Thalassobacillus pellis]
MVINTISGHVQEIKNEIIETRRKLHQNPELSGEEYETSALVQQKLEEYGIPYQTGFAGTGVLGIIKGSSPGKTVALRADMDALPIQEMNDLPFTSQKEGIMHACGHDAHTAMLLGAGYTLRQMKEQINGTVLLVFQPSEENAPVGGAQQMMDDGIFSEYRPDVIYGQHVWPTLPVGEIGVRDKEMMGASDRFKVTVTGRGGHASMPQESNDAIIITNQIISSLQTIVSRNVDPLEAAVVTIGKIEGGYRYNVIADKVTLEGTVRTYLPQIKEKVKDRLHTIIRQTASAFDGNAEIEYLDGYPATINTPKWANQVRMSAQELLGEQATPDVAPVLAGEDFSRFLQNIPGAFIWLGTQIPDKENQKPLHDPRFQLDEHALPNGCKLLAKVAIDTLTNLKGSD